MSKLITLKIKQLKTSLRNHVPERMLRHHSLMGAIRIWLVALQKGCRPFRNIVDYGMNRPQKRCWQATESSQQDISSSANSESAAYDYFGLNRPTITNIARKGVSLLDFFSYFCHTARWVRYSHRNTKACEFHTTAHSTTKSRGIKV